MGVSAFFTVSDSAISQPQSSLTLSGPTAKAHAGAGWGAGGFLSWAVNPKAFHLQKMSVNRSKMLKNANCSWFLVSANRSCGCSGHDLNKHHSKNLSSSQMLKHFATQWLPDAHKDVLVDLSVKCWTWDIDLKFCLESAILKAAPGSYVQTLD